MLKSAWLGPGLIAASFLSAGAAAPLTAVAQPSNDVSGVTIEGRAPTSVTVNIVGKSRHQVFQEVRTAARFVCRNAYLNGDLGAYAETYSWCPYRTTDAAFGQYEAILRANPGVEVAAITIGASTARD